MIERFTGRSAPGRVGDCTANWIAEAAVADDAEAVTDRVSLRCSDGGKKKNG